MKSGFNKLVWLAILASTFAFLPAQAAGAPPVDEPIAVSLADSLDMEGMHATELPDLLYSLSVDVSLCSKYLFQGIDYSGGAVAQPEAVVGYKNFTATSWFNVQPGISQVNEVDLTLKLSHEIQRLTVAGGYNYLAYPHRGWDPSQEVLLELDLDAPLSPSFNIHYDFEAGDGSYMQLSLRHPVAPNLSLATNMFYQKRYYAMTGIPSVEIKASSLVTLGFVTVTPALSYFYSHDNGDFRDDLRPQRSYLLSVNLAQQVR